MDVKSTRSPTTTQPTAAQPTANRGERELQNLRQTLKDYPLYPLPIRDTVLKKLSDFLTKTHEDQIKFLKENVK